MCGSGTDGIERYMYRTFIAPLLYYLDSVTSTPFIQKYNFKYG